MGFEQEIWKEVVEGRIPKLGLQDRFPFECKRCNRCCRNKEILLTPFDIIRISHYLNLTTGEFVRKYGICYIGPYSKIPLVLIDFEKKRCPFLRSYGCTIHSVKPTICRRYPLGKVTELKPKTKEEKVIYFMQPLDPGCQGLEVNSDLTVEEYLKENDMQRYDEAGKIWLEITTSWTTVVDLIEGWDEEIKQSMYKGLAQVLYDSDVFKLKAKDPLGAIGLIKQRFDGMIEAMKKMNEETRRG